MIQSYFLKFDDIVVSFKSLKVKVHIKIIINELICLDLLQNNPSGGGTGQKRRNLIGHRLATLASACMGARYAALSNSGALEFATIPCCLRGKKTHLWVPKESRPFFLNDTFTGQWDWPAAARHPGPAHTTCQPCWRCSNATGRGASPLCALRTRSFCQESWL